MRARQLTYQGSLSILAAALGLLCALLPAARGDEAEGAEARKLYQEGQIEFDLSHYANARDKMEAAYRLKPVPALLYNLAVCYKNLGQYSAALRALRTFVDRTKDNPAAVERAKAQITECEELLRTKGDAPQPAQAGAPPQPPGAQPPPPAGQPMVAQPATAQEQRQLSPVVPVGGGARPGDAGELVTVAIAEFRSTGVAPELRWLGRSFSDALIARLSRAKTVRIVEREYLDQLVGELKLQSSSLVDERSAVQVGRLLGARVFVFGSIEVLGTDAVARARIVSIERGEVLGTVEATGSTGAILALQADVAKQAAAALAVQAAIGDGAGLELSDLALAAFADLDRVQQLARGLPYYGVDPARRRRAADFQLGLTLCDKLITYYPKLGQAHYYRGLFSLQTDDLDRAGQEAAAAAKLLPDDAEAALLPANVAVARRDFAGAVRLLRTASERFGGDARVWYALGRALVAVDDKPSATAALIAAQERSPAIPEAETTLRTLVAGPEGAAIVATLERQEPRRAPVAALYRANWAGDRAQMAALAPAAQRAAPNLWLGWFAEGRTASPERAEALYRKALALSAAVPEIHRELGRLLLRSGTCAEGERHLGLYQRNALATDDFTENQELVRRCK